MLPSFSVFSQQKQVDSLFFLIKSAKHDSIRLSLYFRVLDVCEIKDNLKYVNEAIVLTDQMIAKEKNEKQREKLYQKKALIVYYLVPYYETLEGLTSHKLPETHERIEKLFIQAKDTANAYEATLHQAMSYHHQGNYLDQFSTLKKGFDLSEKAANKKQMSRFTKEIALLFAEQKDTIHAVDYLNTALGIEKQIGDSLRINRSLVFAGDFYMAAHNYKKAAEYYHKAVVYYEYKKMKQPLASLHKDVATAYFFSGKFDKSIDHLNKSLSYLEEPKDPLLENKILSLLGDIYRNTGENDKAIEIHLKALKICNGQDSNYFWIRMAENHMALAKDFSKVKNFRKAKFYVEQQLSLTNKYGVIEYITEAQQLCAKVDSALGDYRSAFLHYQEYIRLKEKQSSAELKNTATREKFKAQIARQQEEQEQKEQAARAEIEKQKLVRNGFIWGFILVFAFSVFIYRNYRQKQKLNNQLANKNKEIEEKNKDILDSIRYAKRIQASLMPTEKYIDRILTKKDENQGH